MSHSVGAAATLWLRSRRARIAEFTPFSTLMVIGLNLVTDMIVWNGWTYVAQPTAFFATNAIIVCGVYLLSGIGARLAIRARGGARSGLCVRC